MIDDAEVTRFCNEKIRPTADELERTYRTADSLLAYWQANPELQAKIPNDDTPIVDGSEQDGRQPITGADVWNILTRAGEVSPAGSITRSNAPLWDAFSINTILGVSVNGEPIF